MRLPSNSQRISIIGRTGSGKTVAALWHLSQHDLPKERWIIFDFKKDDHLAELKAQEIDITDKVPHKKGLYIVRPMPDDGDDVDGMFMRIWEKENTGVYIDEAYMIGNGRGDSRAFKALLTQGRSKHIPMIVLSQRPVYLSKFVWSESDFFQVFQINNDDDIRVVRGFVPFDFKQRLPEHWSVYYDVGKNETLVLQPVPESDSVTSKVRAEVGVGRVYL